MPIYHVTLPDGHTYQVDSPRELSDAEVYQHATAGAASSQSDDVSSLLGPALTGAARASVPAMQRVAEEVATHPGIADAGQGLGRLLGGITGFKGGYLGMKTGEAVGGAAGRGLVNLVQRGAGSVAPYVAPVMEALSPVGDAALLYQLLTSKLLGGQSAVDAQAERLRNNSAQQNALEAAMK